MAGKKNTNLGNHNAMKYQSVSARRQLLEKYLKHIEAGFSDHSFPECDMDTLKSYIEKFPSDFPTDRIDRSRRLRMFKWEKIGLDGVLGKIPRFSGKGWEFNMRNRFSDHWSDQSKSDHSTLEDHNAIMRDIIRRSAQADSTK